MKHVIVTLILNKIIVKIVLNLLIKRLNYWQIHLMMTVDVDVESMIALTILQKEQQQRNELKIF